MQKREKRAISIPAPGNRARAGREQSVAGRYGTTATEADYLTDLPVVLSAPRLLQPQQEAPAAVTVIGQEMIRASGFRGISDLLCLVPGFGVSDYAANITGGDLSRHERCLLAVHASAGGPAHQTPFANPG
ncbi:hypothetical protein TPL01_30450 [Sulfuriferula plumbiphila]|uniref:TonB-dependent receptor plug domain-containing protein n=1 Tax=Sulfuriferula plumbiphila TaxID=171865 RepID=A0A512LBP6_9PROT|nr:hypothetical protein [Sulfuriferula plumbiphila]BBP03326.1 hypothetical protein SFPGR_07480 [Sulfuriferula plumbiphila]GEP31907.1 hypothetical protein TPL01_30450 [Sulfuriferula plumbiphila]